MVKPWQPIIYILMSKKQMPTYLVILIISGSFVCPPAHLMEGHHTVHLAFHCHITLEITTHMWDKQIQIIRLIDTNFILIDCDENNTSY